MIRHTLSSSLNGASCPHITQEPCPVLTPQTHCLLLSSPWWCDSLDLLFLLTLWVCYSSIHKLAMAVSQLCILHFNITHNSQNRFSPNWIQGNWVANLGPWSPSVGGKIGSAYWRHRNIIMNKSLRLHPQATGKRLTEGLEFTNPKATFTIPFNLM